MNGAAPAPQQHVAGDDEIRMLAVKAFNEAIDADGYETSYDIIANAIKAALGQTALRKDNGDELLGAHPSRFGNPDLAHEGDEPGVAVQLNGEVRGTDHRVSPLSREENTPPDDLPLSKVAASILARARDLASVLRVQLGQHSYSIVTPSETIWVSHRPEDVPPSPQSREVGR